MASDTAVSRDAASPPEAASPYDGVAAGRQRPEEILAQTLSVTAHPEATEGWSSRGRRIFLIAMAAAGVILVVAGLLVTKELAPGTGSPAPLQTGPGSGLANQLLGSTGSQSGGPAPASDIAIPIPSTPTTRPPKTLAPSPGPVPSEASNNQPPNNDTQSTSPPTTKPQSPTTTIPCSGLLGQGIQQAVPLPCRAGTQSSSPLG